MRAYPRRVLLTVILEMNQIPHNVRGLTEAYYHGVCPSSEENIEKKRSLHMSLPQPLSDVKPHRVLTTIRTHASSHALMELADNG